MTMHTFLANPRKGYLLQAICDQLSTLKTKEF